MSLTKVQPEMMMQLTPAIMPAGSVIQTVNGYLTPTNGVSTSSSTFTDTGLTATITPIIATSKILVTVNIVGISKYTSNTYVFLNLVRNGTQLIYIENLGGYTNDTSYNAVGGSGTTYLDSPATTSALTYKVQFASGANNAAVTICSPFSSTSNYAVTSTITLQEIKQ